MTTTTEPQHPPRRFLRFPAAGLLTSGLLLLTLALLAKADDPIPNLDFPKDANVSLGATVTFQASASTTNGPLTFQWQHSGTNLDGATSSSLRLTSVTELHAGAYQAVISNAGGNSATSRVAQLSVDPTFIKITSGRLVQDVEPSENATWWDPDGDDFLDVYVHNIGATALLQSFYWNNGDGTFTKDTTNALALARKRGIMAGVGDYDNDGDQDLYVSGNAHPATTEPTCDLYRNDGNGVFTRLVGQPWTQDADLSQDCPFVDYDQDGLLDIFVVNGHRALPCLYRQTPAGSFVKLTAAQVGSLLIDPPESYNGAWADYDNDGDLDMFFENARGYSRLHRNDGHGFFSLVTPECFNLFRAGGLGMWGDYDNDGFLDLFVGGYGDDGSCTNALYHNLAGQGFTNLALEAGVAVRMGAWASAWGDYDNDGWLDLFMADWQGVEPSRLFRNRGDGTFESIDVGSPMRDGGDSRSGVRWVDYDNDGFLDLFLTCGTQDKPRPNHLYRNNLSQTGNTHRWLKIKLNGQASNRSGIGAKIRIKATIGGRELWQMREMTGNGYSQTCPGLVAHFGLGDAAKADLVRIEWPSGIVQELTNVPAGLTGQPPISITEHQQSGPPAPRFNAATPSPGGLELSVTEPATGACYCLEASTDLMTWTKLMARTSAGGTHEWIDAQATNRPVRFYRLVVP